MSPTEKAVIRDFNGSNHQYLSETYNLSMTQVYRLLRKAGLIVDRDRPQGVIPLPDDRTVPVRSAGDSTRQRPDSQPSNPKRLLEYPKRLFVWIGALMGRSNA
ncbi:MAG: hypothetical protein KZQ94_22715 [Candidatus Thiodiazotropha sp. (ex Troendleina suluensis)]|nr:hypothetical protein [Candidatus Thiodiazotropha sp. (ex Troendleina suluensis)]MCU7842170.1 hypothetical protein [Candidatus Thiodiazotropha sp. (ex Troendleina suluensis)]